MTNRVQSKRLALFQWLLAGAFVALAGWLVYLQGICHEDLKQQAEANTHRKIFLEPRRGDILDIKRNTLATSVFVKTVCADPQLLCRQEAPVAPVVAHALAPLLEMKEQDVLQRLLMLYRRGDKGQVITNRYVVLKRKVSADIWLRIQQTMTNLTFGVDEKRLPESQKPFYRNLRQHAIFTDPVDDQLRFYPNHTLAAHVLGYVGMTNQTSGSNQFTTIVGADGIERTFNTDLRGVRGWRLTEIEIDKTHHRLERVDLREQDVEPHDGLNVVLTLDSNIQHITEEALAGAMAEHAPISASAVVVRPRTGELLAMAVLPNFDPNDLNHSTPDARRDRLICDTAEPGSTFKIVVVSGALNDGVVQLTDRFDCEHGHFSFCGKILHDHKAYDVLTVQQIITKSSNIGAAKIGIKLGEQRLHRYMLDFGFYTRTGLPLVGEVPGLVHPLTNWTKLSISRIPMGHEVAVTPLQMVMAMCAIANGGLLMHPLLVDRLEDRDGKAVVTFGPQKVRQVISPAAAKLMVQALKTVVSAEGTAAKAALEHYSVAGKTGTAQKPIPGGGGYSTTKFFSSFIGFFPSEAPELCVAVFMDEPKDGHYGGDVAAPIFKQIAERAANYLSLRPDLDSGSDSATTFAAPAAHD